MAVSRMTAMMIYGNDGRIVETPERLEYWITKEGNLHALMLSCPLDKRSDLEHAVKVLKEESPFSQETTR